MMKKRNGILPGLIAACAACVVSAASFSLGIKQTNDMAPVSIRYVVDGVDAAIGFYTKLTELAGVRYLIDDTRGAVDLYATHLALATDVPAGTITSGRARSILAGVVGLISLIIGGLALARTGRIGTGSGRAGSIVALVLGLIGIVLSVVHLAGSTGFGTGGGRAGAIVALVLGLIGMSLGGLALARTPPFSQRRLTRADPARLVERLIATLDAGPEVEDPWAAEVERCQAEIENGTIPLPLPVPNPRQTAS